MKNRFMACVVVTVIIAFFLSSCASAAISPTVAATSSESGATLVQQRCTMCHPLGRVEAQSFTAAQWKIIVDQMIARGAQLTPGEETVVVNYLATNFGK